MGKYVERIKANRIEARADYNLGLTIGEEVAAEAEARIEQLEKIIEEHIEIMEAFNGSSLPEAWDFVDEVKDAREVLKDSYQPEQPEQPTAWMVAGCANKQFFRNRRTAESVFRHVDQGNLGGYRLVPLYEHPPN